MRSSLTIVSLALVCFACHAPPPTTIEVPGPTPPESAQPVSEAAAPPTGPSAIEAIKKVKQGPSSWAVVEAAPLRDMRLASALAGAVAFGDSMKEAGIDPPHDFDRMLLVFKPTLTLIQHHIPAPKVEAFLANAMEESNPPGAPLTLGARSCIVLHGKYGKGVVCPLTPELLVVSAKPNPEVFDAIAASSGIAPPPKGEAVYATTEDTSIYKFLKIPTVLGAGALSIRARSGGLDVEASFASAAPDEHLPLLEDSLERFHSFLHLDVFADGGRVRVKTSLTAEETNGLAALVSLGDFARVF